MKEQSKAYPKFSFDNGLTQEHIQFFNKNGFIQFKNFLSKTTVFDIVNSLKEIEQTWVAEDRKMVNGVPIVYGSDENGNKIVHRFAFTNQYSPVVNDMVSGKEIKSLIKLLGSEGGRLGLLEKDGVVVNHYVNAGQSQMKQMGWHTDSLRDIFYGHKVMPMLNVGIYLTDSTKAHGGLRVLAGSHKQGVYNLLFRKPYYVSNKPDKNEVLIEAEAGDLTVHHGSIWHRVAQSQLHGEASKRITMYIPIICGKYMPKNEKSATPLYQKMRIFAKK